MRARQFKVNSNSWLMLFISWLLLLLLYYGGFTYEWDEKKKLFKIFTHTHTSRSVPRISLDAQYITSRINSMMWVFADWFSSKKFVVFFFSFFLHLKFMWFGVWAGCFGAVLLFSSSRFVPWLNASTDVIIMHAHIYHIALGSLSI